MTHMANLKDKLEFKCSLYTKEKCLFTKHNRSLYIYCRPFTLPNFKWETWLMREKSLYCRPSLHFYYVHHIRQQLKFMHIYVNWGGRNVEARIWKRSKANKITYRTKTRVTARKKLKRQWRNSPLKPFKCTWNQQYTHYLASVTNWCCHASVILFGLFHIHSNTVHQSFNQASAEASARLRV